MRKTISDIHFSLHSILTDDSLRHKFYEWATGQELDKLIPRTLDFVFSPIRQSDFPKYIEWADVVDYAEKIPFRKKSGISKIRNEQLRIQRIDTAEALFDKFLHSDLDAETVSEIENKWNALFDVPEGYPEFNFEVSGMATERNGQKLELYEQQIKGISFLCHHGNGLLAYEVGAGKTYCGIASIVYQMQHGKCKRPLIIVPNAVYSKWLGDIKALFPEIKVNELYNLNPRIIYQMKIEDGTISVCSSEALSAMTFHDEAFDTWIREDFKHIVDEKKQKKFIGAGTKKSQFIYFEDAGFDLICVDEAHRYKNLIRNIAKTDIHNEFSNFGMGTPSARAVKMFAITQYIHRQNNDQNVFFLTATPFTNSPMEIYSMLLYITGSWLPNMGYKTINEFLDEFAEITNEWAVDSKGNVIQKTVMKSFRSLYALQALIRSCIDKVNIEEAEIERPDKITHLEKIYMSDVQNRIFNDEIKNIEDAEDVGEVFTAMNAMRMAMLSPVLVNRARYDFPIPPVEEIVEASPKLKLVCDTVVNCWKAKPKCGQIIYMPRGVGEAEHVRDYIVAHGVPRAAVVLMNSSTDEIIRDIFIDEFNDPEEPLKIIIGSETISEGVDLNGNSIALYNCLLGWNPAEPIQVEGRLWRQGNRQKKVHIVYPVMYNSIDSLIYQKHDEKVSRIDAVWSYRGDKLNVEEINPEDLKLDLIKNPEKKADYLIAVESAKVQEELNYVQEKLKMVSLASSKLKEIQREQYEFIEKRKAAPESEQEYFDKVLEQKKKEIKKLKTNYQNVLGFELDENSAEKEKILTDLKKQVEELNGKLRDIQNKKDSIILEIKKRIEKEEQLESIEDITKRLSKNIIFTSL